MADHMMPQGLHAELSQEEALRLVNSVAVLHAPAAAALVATDKVRADIVAGLRGRADWLKSEYLKGGDFEYLSLRERECRYLAEQIEQGRI